MGTVGSELRILVRAIRNGWSHGAKDVAAAIAYWSFFSLFPMLLGAVGVAGYIFRSDEAQSRLVDFAATALPGSAAFVESNVDAVVGARGALGLTGVLVLFWSASAALGAVSRALNRALEIKPRRNPIVAKLGYFVMTVAVSVLLILSVVATAWVEVVTNIDIGILSRIGIDPEAVSQLSGSISALAAAFLLFLLLYKFAPATSVRWSQALPGAILAAIAFELGKRAFMIYLARFANFEAVYGPLSSIIVLLLWFYVSALIVVFGAEYNIARERSGGPD